MLPGKLKRLACVTIFAPLPKLDQDCAVLSVRKARIATGLEISIIIVCTRKIAERSVSRGLQPSGARVVGCIRDTWIDQQLVPRHTQSR
jgi:hypothetical protein